jgi:hypothetical protein
MRLNRWFAAAIATLCMLAFSLTLAPSAGAATKASAGPTVKWLAPLALMRSSSPDEVTVAGIYKCSAPLDQMHLWVSVKQGGPDPTAEGSSSTVDAWYDTNISQDVAVTCNGRWHHVFVTLGMHPTDFTGRPLTGLKAGKAWMQFCLVQGTDETTAIVASQSRWVKVLQTRS